MKRKICGGMLLLSLALFTGCSLSPEDKAAREQTLKENIETFVDSVVQSKWNDVFKMSDGGFDNSQKLKEHLTQSWVPDATLTGGAITSLAWVTDSIAKVKINWAFQSGSVQSFSSETFVWTWKGNSWKYTGRSLR